MGKKRKKKQQNNQSYSEKNISKKIMKMELLLLTSYRDILTGEQIDSYEDASFHHIVKKEYGGKYTKENGIMLLDETHRFLHNYVELIHPETFHLLTECMFLLKQCMELDYNDLICQFEDEVQPLVRTLKDSYYQSRR